MFKKNILIFISLVLLLGIFAGCANQAQAVTIAKGAAIQGYPDRTFAARLGWLFDLMIETASEEDVDTTYSIDWKHGWQGGFAPHTSRITTGNEPITCVVNVKIAKKGIGDTENNKIIFYLELNMKTKTLIPICGCMVEDSYETEFSKKDIADFLDGDYI